MSLDLLVDSSARGSATMLSDTSHDAEHFARHLRAALLDRSFWSAAEARDADPVLRSEMTSRAHSIYRETWPFFDERAEGTEVQLGVAVGLLRDVANTCAVLSRSWPADDRESLHVANRAVIERTIRQHGLVDWAAALGVDLPLHGAPIDEPHLGRTEWSEHEFAADLAKTWVGGIELFGEVLNLRPDPQKRGILRELHESACQMVSAACGMMGTASSQLDPRAAAVALTQLIASEAIFIASTESETLEAPFPDARFVGRLLTLSGGADWLTERDVRIPGWLESPE